jgi:O-antigen/teichoic acid export membrane protein
MNELVRAGKRAFIWDFAGKLLTQIITLLIVIVMARLLSPSDFGMIAMVMSVVGIASIFSDVGLGAAIIQRRRLHQLHYDSVFYFNIVTGLFFTVVTFLSATQISNFFNNSSLVPLFEVLSLLFLINAFGSLKLNLLKKSLRFDIIAKVTLVATLLSGVIGIICAIAGFGVWSIVWQILFASLLTNIMIWFQCQEKFLYKFSWKALKQLWGFGFRVYLADVMEAMFKQLDYMIIGKLFIPATLGFYQRAKSLNELVVRYSSSSLMSVLFPILSRLQHDFIQFRIVVLQAYHLILFVSFLLVGSLYLVSEEFILLLFGQKWLLSVSYFQIFVLSAFAYPLSALLVNVLVSRGKSKLFLKLEIYKKLLLLVTFIAGFSIGIEGYLYGLIIFNTLALYLNILFVSKELGISAENFVKPLLIQAGLTGGIVMAIVWGMQLAGYPSDTGLIIKGILFVVLYFLMNFILKNRGYQEFLRHTKPLTDRFLNKEVSNAK